MCVLEPATSPAAFAFSLFSGLLWIILYPEAAPWQASQVTPSSFLNPASTFAAAPPPSPVGAAIITAPPAAGSQPRRRPGWWPLAALVLVAFAAGVLSFLSPCVLPLVPPYLGYISGTTIEQMTVSIDQTARDLESLAGTVGETTATVEEIRAVEFHTARKGGYDMDAVELIGLVKLDILAQGGLAVMRDVKTLTIRPDRPDTQRPARPPVSSPVRPVSAAAPARP